MDRDKPFETIDCGKGVKVQIFQEVDLSSPRENDNNLGHMCCWHQKYNLGDKHSFSTPRDLYSHLAEELGEDTSDTDTLDQLLAKLDDRYVFLPLYLYDHGGITMSTRAFSDPWDSGQVGIIYMSLKEAENSWLALASRRALSIMPSVKGWESPVYYAHDNTTKTLRERAIDVLSAEVKFYDQYLTGDVWYYRIETPEDKNVDSCGCFYGLDSARAEGKTAADNYAKNHADPQRTTGAGI